MPGNPSEDAYFGDSSGGGSGESRGLFLGTCRAALNVRKLIERAAQVDSAVLITGESGVGKELVAREIHGRSDRRGQPFVPLNCAAIPESLIEAELFGHEPGAYTDAKEVHRGAFEMANHGTLFLDEVGDLSSAAQPKLLRVLESGEIVRLGGEKPRSTDLRIIAATNQSLKTMCREKKFRADLYFRLGVLAIRVPPLRERLDDIPMLANHFVRLLADKLNRDFQEITPSAMEYLMTYNWPGNVRELKAIVERALVMNSSSSLDASCFELDPVSLPGNSLGGLLNRDWRSAREAFEAAYARRLLDRHGDVKSAAEAAGMATGSLYKMLRRLGLRTRRED